MLHPKNRGKQQSLRDRRLPSIRRWLEAFDCQDVLDKIPLAAIDVLCRNSQPRPEVFISGLELPELVDAVNKMFDDETLQAGSRQRTLPAIEAVTVLPWVICLLENCANRPGFLKDRKLDEVVREGDALFDAALEKWDLIIDGLLAQCCRIDGLLADRYREVIEYAPGRKRLRTKILLSQAKSERLEIDNELRRIYPVLNPMSDGDGGGEVPHIPHALLPGLSVSHPCPIYIQGHALRRLSERLDGPAKPPITGMFHKGLAIAVSKPVVVSQPTGGLMLQYHLGTMNIGYLPFKIVDGKVVISTFLLAGMQGTPESQLLYETMRIQRRDFEWIGLDTLDRWVASDLRSDREIRPILESCGLSGLLQFADLMKQDPKFGLAATFKSFISKSALNQKPSGRA